MNNVERARKIVEDQCEAFRDDKNVYSTRFWLEGFVAGLSAGMGLGDDATEDLLEYVADQYPTRPLIIDLDGNTYSTKEIRLWNENDPESPIAVFGR